MDCESQFEVGTRFCNVGNCLCSRRNMHFSLQLFSFNCFMMTWMLPHSAVAMLFLRLFPLIGTQALCLRAMDNA